jgi:SAM-dependent methyltransferase
MASATPDIVKIKEGMKAGWMAGDFGRIANLNENRGQEFVDRLGLKHGMRVLDVACGTGNQALPAARTGADVTGLDLAPNLLAQAREQAEKEGLQIRLMEGDAEELPFGDAEFDVVYSMFGAMFAPRPERVARELVRVCKPGGLVAMANWTPASFSGQMFKINGKYAPPPPGVPAPVMWGDEAVVRERFGPKVRIETTKRELIFDLPFGPAEVVELFSNYFGPMKLALSKLDAATQKAMLAELTQHWASHNEGDATHTVVRNEYLEVYVRP